MKNKNKNGGWTKIETMVLIAFLILGPIAIISGCIAIHAIEKLLNK